MAPTRDIPDRDTARRDVSLPCGNAARDRQEAELYPRISPAAEVLIGTIHEGLIVHARLRERPTGDLIDLAVGPMFLPGAWRSCDIIDALQELRDHGLVQRSETVSRGDSSEYVLTYSAKETERAGGEPQWKDS